MRGKERGVGRKKTEKDIWGKGKGRKKLCESVGRNRKKIKEKREQE